MKSWMSLLFGGRFQRIGGRIRKFRESGDERSGRTDSELAVGAGEVRLDGMHAHEERGGDLLVRAPLRGQHRNPLLGLGQLGRGALAPADPPELGSGSLLPQAGAELVEDGERLLERLA